MENINYELIGSIFISIMATKFFWDFGQWVEKWIDKVTNFLNKQFDKVDNSAKVIVSKRKEKNETDLGNRWRYQRWTKVSPYALP